jgi:hypothetical protein
MRFVSAAVDLKFITLGPLAHARGMIALLTKFNDYLLVRLVGI